MPTVISLVSQKGGVGKTTTAVNLAVCFAFGGFKTLLIDLDPQGSVRFSMNLADQQVKYGTKDLFTSNSVSPSDLIVKTPFNENLNFIFSNIDKLVDERDINRRAMAHDHLKNVMDEYIKDYEIVVIDAPASTNNITLNAIYASDLILLPVQCEKLAVKSLKRFLLAFHELQRRVTDKELKIAGIILTMFDKTLEVHQEIARQMYQSLSDCLFQTIIPRHESIVNASAVGAPLIVDNVNTVGAIAYIYLMNEIIERHKDYFVFN